MMFSSPQSLRATSIRHHDRGLTLVFGPDGQVSLIGFDGGTASQASYTFPVGDTRALTATPSLPSDPPSISPIPNLEATSTSLIGTLFTVSTSTPTPTSSTFISSSLTLSNSDPSSTATDTDTNLPSIPTVNYPTPSPTPVTNPKDRGVGAPFYLAIVLASISFIGCVAAFIAWWIRSRSRRHDLEFDDPWHHRRTVSEGGSAITDNADTLEKGETHAETQTQPYYLPASLVRRSSSNQLAVPHTNPAVENGISRTNMSRAVLDLGRLPYSYGANDTPSKNTAAAPGPHAPSSQITSLPSHPGMERLPTGLSVQESTRTLGRLRVANRVPGDVTSGDEGGMGVPRLPNGAGLPPVANSGRPDVIPSGENTMQSTHLDESGREGDVPLEPPGPATLSWGRRTDTVAALRRTRRRTPQMTTQNASYAGYSYAKLDGEPSRLMPQPPATPSQEENDKAHANAIPDYLGWKSTLKSSFWQAVDAMTGNRPPGPDSATVDGGSGSRFTPAPQRVASRRSPVSPSRPSTTLTLADPHSGREETKIRPDQTLFNRPAAAHEIPRSLAPSSYARSSARKDELQVPHISEVTLESVSSPPRVSHLNRNLSTSTHRRHPDSLRTDTGSVYSTESSAARANLRKYGYGSRDTIPSSWSALGAARESQLDLERTYLPLPKPISSSPSPLSAPSELMLGSPLLSSSVSTRTRSRTPAYSEKSFVGSDATTSRSGKYSNIADFGETASSKDSMSRNSTIQSGRGTIGHGTVSLVSTSTTSSMLSRKKGVTARRNRPKPPPRALSSASSVQSMESGLSIRQVAVRRALLERQKKAKAAESLQGHEDTSTRNHDSSSLV